MKRYPKSAFRGRLRGVLDLNEAQEQLERLHEPIVEGFKAGVGAWGKLIDVAPDLALPLDATARANFIHPHVCREVGIRVAALEDVTPTDALDFHALKIGPKILLRFKFVGHGAPHNYQTPQQRLLGNQHYTADMALRLTGDPSLEVPTLLTAGYTLEGRDLQRVEIRRDCEGHLPWSYDIFGGDQVFAPVVMPGLEDTTRPAVVVSRKRPPLELVDVDEAEADA